VIHLTRFHFVAVLLLVLFTGHAMAADHVNGNLILFNDNGAWCWFQDPRAIYDATNDALLFGSIAVSDGVDGAARSGDVDLVTYHLSTGERRRFVLRHNLHGEDDHNTAALLIRPDGRYLAMYSRHNQDALSYWRVSENPHEASSWRDEQVFDWASELKAGDSDNHITYSNLFFLSAENRAYDFTRAVNLDPSILLSIDQGDSWKFAGKLFTEPRVGYVNGYTKYASNGVDQIDFITTEHHPRDFNNNVYHGYLQGGKVHRSDGSVFDPDVLYGKGKSQTDLTKIFAADSVFNGEVMTHAWTADLRVDSKGQPCAILTARANDQPENSNFEDHRFIYARFDGGTWKVSHLAKAGARLWESEQDYTGLGAINPDDVNTVYISTTTDPRTDASLAHHEIFKGVTTDSGATWTWSAITEDSSVDNLRPVIVSCGGGRVAVLWFRGTMWRSQRYDCGIVGVIEGERKPIGEVTVLNDPAPATQATTQASAFVRTLPKLDAGAYDIFIFCQTQGLRAGLLADRKLMYRGSSCQQTKSGLYRGYLGRVNVSGDRPVEVFIEGLPSAFAGLGYARAK
jgi:hypothetical protein